MPHFAIMGSRGFPSTYGGFETFVRRLAPYLVAHGDQVTVYCREGAAGEAWHDGVRCVTTRGLPTNAASTLSHGFTAALDARKRDIDAALVLNVANGFFLPTLKRAGIPTAVNVDGIEWQRAKWNRFGKAVFRRGAQLTSVYADHIVVDSRAIGNIWRDEFHRTSSFIPYGADVVDHVGDARVRDLKLDPGTYVLAVARLAPENNIDLLLDTLPLLPAELPVVVVGSANKPNRTTERLRELNAFRPNFYWLGHLHDQDLLSQLWAHCLTYFHGHSVGGTNPALLQAMALGAPPLALDTAFNREVLQDDGFLTPHAPDVVASRLRQRLHGSIERPRLSAAAKAIISDRYRWDDVLKRYRSLMLALATPTANQTVSRVDKSFTAQPKHE